MIIKVKDKEYSLNTYNSVQKLADECYQQGRADERPKAFGKGYDSGYRQGRADAINECYMKAKTKMDELRYHYSNKRAGKTQSLYCLQALDFLRQVAEELKEKKNEV